MRQQDLAMASGVKFQSIQKYESGLNRVSCSRLVKMAELLEVSPIVLLGEYGSKKSNPAPKLGDEQRRHLLQTAEMIAPEDVVY